MNITITIKENVLRSLVERYLNESIFHPNATVKLIDMEDAGNNDLSMYVEAEVDVKPGLPAQVVEYPNCRSSSCEPATPPGIQAPPMPPHNPFDVCGQMIGPRITDGFPPMYPKNQPEPESAFVSPEEVAAEFEKYKETHQTSHNGPVYKTSANNDF